MKITHEYTFARKCPVNDGKDVYTLIVETEGLVMVEAILAAINKLPETAFQEHITDDLASSLPGCKVTTICLHSGIKTTCTA